MTVLMGPVATWLLFSLLSCLVTFVVICLLIRIAFRRVRSTIPSAEDWKRSKVYRSWINAVTGTVFNEAGDITWRFDPARLPRKTDFLVYAADGHEILCIHRYRFLPPQFQLLEAGSIVGTVRLQSVLLNKYTLDLPDGTVWTFVMLLYTVHFRGDSNKGEEIRIWMSPNKRQWNVLVSPAFDNTQVLAAIAFIHRRWYL